MESWFEGFFGFFVVLGLLLCPLVLLLLASILIATLMAIYTFLRNLRKPTQYYASNTLIGLPAELRLIIYEFALQDSIDSLVSIPSLRHTPSTRQPYKSWRFSLCHHSSVL
jgi:hypothetical protein